MPGQTRRHHLMGLAAIGAVSGAAGCASVTKSNGYLGPWSSKLEDGAESALVKLVILSDSDARMFLVDRGYVELKATLVNLAPDKVTIEFDGIEERFTGGLTSPNILRLTTTGLGTVDFTRGDLFKPEPLSAQTLASARRSSGAPAMGVAYARGGAKPKILADGVRSLNAATPITPDDAWCIGSITKSMTATLAGRLVDAGHVTWDVTIADILGAAIPDMHDSYRDATLRNLLNHRAGLRSEIATKDYNTFSLDGLDDPRPERLKWASLALKLEPVAAPNERTLYANNGYVVVGAMLEALRGQSWETLMREEVFAPLGLKSAGFGVPGTPGKLDQPIGHSVSPTDAARLVPADPAQPVTADLALGRVYVTPIAKGPAGRVYIRLADLIAYLNAHLLRPPAFLGLRAWATLQTPPEGSNYAMGWEVQPSGRLTHSGSNGFWWAQVAIDPTARAVAAAAANDGRGDKMMGPVGLLVQGALMRARG